MTCCKNERLKNPKEPSEYENKNKVPKRKTRMKMLHRKEGKNMEGN
jgi:hypothetical protein